MENEIPKSILEKINEDSKANHYEIEKITPYRSISGASVFDKPCTIMEYLIKPKNGREMIVDVFVLNQDGKSYLLKDFNSGN